VAAWFTLDPAKTAHIPHPHYLGSYPDFIPRDQARYDLGLQCSHRGPVTGWQATAAP
jgi:hypothetical protein